MKLVIDISVEDMNKLSYMVMNYEDLTLELSADSNRRWESETFKVELA